jgi:hypothetical protein
MAKKRLLLWLGALGGLAGLGILLLTLVPEPPGVTYTNFERVAIGMSQAEVEAIFSSPPRLTAPNGRNWFGLTCL